jgi:hypothetical protein
VYKDSILGRIYSSTAAYKKFRVRLNDDWTLNGRSVTNRTYTQLGQEYSGTNIRMFNRRL